MEGREQESIERYLAGELSDDERAILETRMAQDDNFKKEVELYKLTLVSLRLKRKEELKMHFKTRDRDNGKAISWKIIGLLLFVILAISLIFIWKNKTSEFIFKKNVEQKLDSSIIHIDEIPSKDTLISPSEPQNKNDNTELQKAKSKPLAEKSYTGDELYAMNYKPYKDETLDPTIRGNEVLSPYDTFIKFYWDGHYQEAIAAFDLLSPALQINDNITFVKANALMAIGNMEEAKLLFESIIQSNKSRYVKEAKWYLGLIYLKANNRRDALKLFHEIKLIKNANIRNKVNSLLDKTDTELVEFNQDFLIK